MWKSTALTLAWFAGAAGLLVAGPLAVTGCDKPAPTAAVVPARKPPGPPAAVPAGFVLDKAPDGVKDLAAAKSAGVADGDEVVVRAIVGGDAEPFKADQAVVRVMDASVMTCDRMGMDEEACPTPWDACCHQKDATAKGAVVRVLAADGAPLKGTLEGVGGMKPAAEVVVIGKARTEAGTGLVIEATHVFVKATDAPPKG
jgi:hypothetical protein